MLDHDDADSASADIARERLYGAKEAAELLGIHRSTLHLAVRNHQLQADGTTPGGHLRFRRETLEAFRSRLRHEAATGEMRLTRHAHVLARIAHTLATAPTLAEPEETCRTIVANIRAARLDVDMACIALRTNDPTERYALRIVAQYGFPAWYFREYARLRWSTEQAALRVQQTLCPVTCEDTREVRNNAAVDLARKAGIRSYVVVPVLAAHELFGVLVAASTSPRSYSAGDLLLFQGIADELAVALCVHAASPIVDVNRPRRYLDLTRELTLAALALRHRRNSSSCMPPLRVRPQEVTALGHLLLHATHADDACALGFDRKYDLRPAHPQLLAVACQACAGDALVVERWSEDGFAHTALAASIPLSNGLRGGVGALWHTAYPSSDAEHALLTAFAGAYALALGLS